jgi:pimeloyl-ACP methyl ester carboxylesterase
MSEEFQVRLQGPAGAPTLIYLPGLHGDWTLIGNFRRALKGRVQFVECTYPRTLDWPLEVYAQAAERALEALKVTEGWLLGESFGSLVVWELVRRRRFPVRGVILAGGFVKHPLRGGAALLGKMLGGMPLSLITRIMFGYARVTRVRFGRSPEIIAELEEFIQRRTDLDRRAAVHRLRLVAKADYRGVAAGYRGPFFSLSGLLDPMVPWFLVKPWMTRSCPSLGKYQVIMKADHNVLGTAPVKSAEQVLNWMQVRQSELATEGPVTPIRTTARVANE